MQKLSSKVYLSHQHWHTSFCILVVLRSLNIVIITPVTKQNDSRSRGQKPCSVRKVQILLLLFNLVQRLLGPRQKFQITDTNKENLQSPLCKKKRPF